MGSQIKKADLTKPRKTLEALYRKKLKPSRLESFSPYKKVGELMRGNWQRNQGDKRGFYEFLSSIARRRWYRIYHEADTLLAMYLRADDWQRSPKGWMPEIQANSGEVLMLDLLKFLFVKYEVPQFMYRAWQSENPLHLEWFIHLAKGQNIKTAPKLYARLTKKMAHYFSQAPAQYSIDEALVFAQVIGQGGEQSLLKQLLNAQFVYLAQDQDFWLSLILFLVNNPELVEDEKVDRIINFFNNRRLTDTRLDEYGQLIERMPEALSLKGKTASSLMREIQEWEIDMQNRFDTSQLITWKPEKTRNFLYRPDRQDIKSPVYRIMQLTNNYALYREANVMRHCVASYLDRCESGQASIWSMTVTTAQAVKSVLTIQVHKGKTIVQVRGKTNRMPTKDESEIVCQWAEREKLKIADYCELH